MKPSRRFRVPVGDGPQVSSQLIHAHWHVHSHIGRARLEGFHRIWREINPDGWSIRGSTLKSCGCVHETTQWGRDTIRATRHRKGNDHRQTKRTNHVHESSWYRWGWSGHWRVSSNTHATNPFGRTSINFP